MRGHVQVAQQDLLIAQREVGDDPGADLSLGGLQRVGVLERVLERHRGQFLRQALTEVGRRHEAQVSLEDVLVHGGRPVVVTSEYQPGAQNSGTEVGEELNESVPQVFWRDGLMACGSSSGRMPL